MARPAAAGEARRRGGLRGRAIPDGSRPREGPSTVRGGKRKTTALALTGGGARAAYQVGVLRWLASRHPEVRFQILTGVSAGAINAAYLAGRKSTWGEAVDDLAGLWGGLTTARIMRSDVPALAANAARVLLNLAAGGSRLVPVVRGLVDTEPLRRFLRSLIDRGDIGRNVSEGRLRALAITATSYETGQTVTFVEGAPELGTWERVRRRAIPARIGVEHVMASSALPVLFPARAVDEHWYGDGSIRQSHPLSPALHLGAERILAISARHAPTGPEAREPVVTGYPPAAQVIGMLLNSIFLDSLDADAERLTRINRLVARVPPERRWLISQREVELLVLRPSMDLGRMATEYERRLPRALRYLIRGLGTRRVATSDLVSYLLFEAEYMRALIELGESDAQANRLRLGRFFEVDA